MIYYSNWNDFEMTLIIMTIKVFVSSKYGTKNKVDRNSLKSANSYKCSDVPLGIPYSPLRIHYRSVSVDNEDKHCASYHDMVNIHVNSRSGLLQSQYY